MYSLPKDSLWSGESVQEIFIVVSTHFMIIVDHRVRVTVSYRSGD